MAEVNYMTLEARTQTPVGAFATLDLAASGPDVLLVHQVTANAQVWAPFGAALATFCHPVAVDLRGHGQTPLDLESAEQLSDDLGHVARALGMHRPLVVAEAISQVVVIAAVRSGALDARGIVLVGDTCTRRGRDAAEWFEEQYSLEAVDRWAERFGLFAHGPAETKQAYLDRIVAAAASDWLVAGVSEQQWRAYLTRSVRDTADGWQRRPTRDAYATFAHAAGQGPLGFDLYDSVGVPLCFVNTPQQLRASDLADLEAYAQSRTDREFSVVVGGPILGLIPPAVLGSAIRRFLSTLDDGSATRG